MYLPNLVRKHRRQRDDWKNQIQVSFPNVSHIMKRVIYSNFYLVSKLLTSVMAGKLFQVDVHIKTIIIGAVKVG